MNTNKTKDFIEKALITHGNLYDYSLSEYVNSRTNIKIICKEHGIFEQTPYRHVKCKNKCSKCSKKYKYKTEEFVEKAKEKHGDKYDYSKVNYINSKTKVIIGCPIHGDFLQKTSEHLNGKVCRKCFFDSVRKDVTLLINEAKEVHKNKYNYDKVIYTNSNKTVTITCPIHGDFERRLNNHIEGAGCTKCTPIDKRARNQKTKTENFIRKAKELHNDKYSYEKTEYGQIQEKLIITCPIHGDFEQTPQGHLRSKGCYTCGSAPGFGRSKYIEKANGKICIFYTIKCFTETEEFYKIGITMNSIQKRYYSTLKMPYSYEIISEIYGEAGLIWDLEKEEKRKLAKFNYQPNVPFDGSKTECFTQYKTHESKY